MAKRFKTPYWYRHFCLYPNATLYRWQRKGEPVMWLSTGRRHVVLFDHQGHPVWTSYIGHLYVWLQSFAQAPHKHRTLVLFRAHGGSKTTTYQILLIGISPRRVVRTQEFWYRMTSPYSRRFHSRFWVEDVDRDGRKEICLTKHSIFDQTAHKRASWHRDVCFFWEPGKERWRVEKGKRKKLLLAKKSGQPKRSKKPRTQAVARVYLSWPKVQRSGKMVRRMVLPAPTRLTESFSFHSDSLGVRMSWKALNKMKHSAQNWNILHNQSAGILKCLDRFVWLYGLAGRCEVSWKRGKKGRPAAVTISKDGSPGGLYRDCLGKALQIHQRLLSPIARRERWLLRWKPWKATR